MPFPGSWEICLALALVLNEAGKIGNLDHQALKPNFKVSKEYIVNLKSANVILLYQFTFSFLLKS